MKSLGEVQFNRTATIIITTIFVISSYCGVLSEEVVIFKCCGAENINFDINGFVLNENDTSDGVNLSLSDSFGRNVTLSDVSSDKCNGKEETPSLRVSHDPSQNASGFLRNGYFRYMNEYYSPHQYCLENVTENEVTVKVQPRNNCDNATCLKKCCGPMEKYDLSTYGKSRLLCVPAHDNPWDPLVYSKGKDGWSKRAASESGMYFRSDHPKNWCTDGVIMWSMRQIGNDRKSLFRILEDGEVVKREGVNWKELDPSRICLDGAINFPYSEAGKDLSFDHELDSIIIECGPTVAAEENAPTVLYGVALFISSLFLLATLIIYGLLWDKQSIHGWTLLGYVTTMLLFYVSLMSAYFYLYNYPDNNFTYESEVLGSFCGFIAIVSHFLYISFVCWLTVISFDIFAKFRILKLTRAKSKQKFRFLVYFFFTITVPLGIVGPGLLLDGLYGDDLEVNVILPRYGWNKCFLDLKQAALPYLFIPIGLLLIFNCILYIATIIYMHKLQESTKFARAGANNAHVHKQRAKIRLFSKLFLLMGISWIFDFASFLAFGASANVLVIVADLINIFQPIAVFIIFVCKREILESLCQKYPSLTKFFSSFEVEDFNTPSTSSNGVASGRLAKIWNPVATTNWFRSRINSTTTDTSNVSNQSIKSNLNAIEATPLPSSLSVTLPLNHESSYSKEV